MKRLILLGLILSQMAYSQDSEEVEGVIDIPLQEFCQHEISEEKECVEPDEKPNALTELSKVSEKLRMPTNCENLMVISKAAGNKPYDIIVKDQKDKRWKLRFYFGNTRASYANSDIRLKTSNMDVKISGMQARERPSDSYYKVWAPHGGVDTWLQWIDEPNNTFKLALEKNNNEFYISIYHPKYTFVQGDVNDQNTNVKVQGTVNGNQVNGYQHIKGAFDENDKNVPNQIHIAKWENSHYFMNWEAGYGRVVPLIKVKDKPILKWTPQVSAGVFTGVNNSGQNTSRWEGEYTEGNKNKIMGVSGTVGNRISITNRADNLGAFVEHRYSVGKMKYDWGDGTAEHVMKSSSFTFGVQIGLVKLGKKPPKGASVAEEAPTTDDEAD